MQLVIMDTVPPRYSSDSGMRLLLFGGLRGVSRALAHKTPCRVWVGLGMSKKKTDAALLRRNNNVRDLREAQMLSKAALARKAGVSPLTIDRIENGFDCRIDTKRKIVLALGFRLSDKDKVFSE